MNKIITIARQFGSGGRLIGKELAQKLNIPFLDNELITLAAKESGMSPEVLKGADERVTSSLLYGLAMGYFPPGYGFSAPEPGGLTITDNLFMVQAGIITKKANEGPCVIVGRCADYVLKENKERVSIFIYADIKSRAERAVNIYGLKPDKAEDEIRKRDKKRGNYYNYYTNRKWDDFHNYHLLLDSARLGITGSVELIIKYLDMLQCSSPE
ncbi:MAG: cytidylate kinase-like family protein [Christensenellaceae bacterium]|mgnify:CR=1 FL=1|nr:cytidylate kinase-like family protein [Christensenellaceae bacterium]